MPVRSLTSFVFKWPNAQTVDQAIRQWAMKIAKRRSDVLQIGYFGSYARGDWGVGSDLDIFILLEASALPFMRRAIEWNTTMLPVPTNVCVYTRTEWAEMATKVGRFYQTIMSEAVWVYRRPDRLNKPHSPYHADN